ncbi:MAG: hypothetical protein HC820_08540 [Hydrococcus sp. RM1_1_31]|nr:hypothetical protein [Hydrococcus sp. RM1_1_31]
MLSSKFELEKAGDDKIEQFAHWLDTFIDEHSFDQSNGQSTPSDGDGQSTPPQGNRQSTRPKRNRNL